MHGAYQVLASYVILVRKYTCDMVLYWMAIVGRIPLESTAREVRDLPERFQLEGNAQNTWRARLIFSLQCGATRQVLFKTAATHIPRRERVCIVLHV
jgi:hypothetical protein